MNALKATLLISSGIQRHIIIKQFQEDGILFSLCVNRISNVSTSLSTLATTSASNAEVIPEISPIQTPRKMPKFKKSSSLFKSLMMRNLMLYMRKNIPLSISNEAVLNRLMAGETPESLMVSCDIADELKQLIF